MTDLSNAAPAAVNSPGLPETQRRLIELDDDIAKIRTQIATADLARSAEYVSAARENVAVLSGDDITALPMWSVGGAGVVSVAGNICPRLMVAMWRAFRDGRQEEALRMHGRLLPLFRALFLESNPTPIKYLMAKQGLTSTYELRLPLVPVCADTAAQLDHCYDALEFDQ